MGHLSRKERFDLAFGLLNSLTDEPQALSDMAANMGVTREVLWHIYKRLKRANLLKATVGPHGGVKRHPTATYTPESVREVLGYGSAPTDREVKCNTCEEFKMRILSGRNPLTNHAIYSDSSGNRWKGYKCPDCSELGHNKDAPVVESKRKCRDCKKNLPVERYFRCFGCQPQLPSIDDDAVYCASDVLQSDPELTFNARQGSALISYKKDGIVEELYEDD